MSTQSWSFKKLLIYNIIVLVFIFLFLEVIYRIAFHYKYRNTHSSVFIQGSTIQMNDEQLIFKNRPFYTDYYLKFQFNEEGMKSKVADALMPQKTKNDYWVFLFGASAMEGMGSNKTGDWLDITGVTDYKWEETIASILEKKLQKRIQGKHVKVFCAANSSYNVYQSMLKYKTLATKYAMDWVVSLDGNNQPSLLDSSISIEEYTKKDWQSYPIHFFPVTWIEPFTSHSAFINAIKQYIYHFKEKQRFARNVNQSFAIRRAWYDSSVIELKYDTLSASFSNALHNYAATLQLFDSILTADAKKHLLIVQPHLSLRDKNWCDSTEKAVYHYYTHTYNQPAVNGFQKKIHQLDFYNIPNLYVMNELHTASFPVFVDYCHFTLQANEYIADFLAKKIAQNQ